MSEAQVLNARAIAKTASIFPCTVFCGQCGRMCDQTFSLNGLTVEAFSAQVRAFECAHCRAAAVLGNRP